MVRMVNAAVVLVLFCTTPGYAQPAQDAPPEPLAGPKVDRRDAAATGIVSFDLDGRVRRPETTAEEAAAKQLVLTDEVRARVDQVFADRAGVLDRFIEENLDLVIRLTTAESAPGREKMTLLAETLKKTETLRAKGPLDKQIKAALPLDQARRFDRLLDAYWDAIAAEDRKQAKPKGRLGAVMDEKFKSLGREAEAAYKRCERSGAILYHYLFDSMELTGVQERQLRDLCSTYSMNGIDNNDKKAQGVMFASLMQVLTPEQGRELARKFKGEAGYQKPTPKAEPTPNEKPAE